MLLRTHDTSEIILNDFTSARKAPSVWQSIHSWHQIFKSHDLQPGDIVALLMRNRSEFVEVILATLVYGIDIVPLNWHLNQTELDKLLINSKAQFLITELFFTSSNNCWPIPVINLEKDWLTQNLLDKNQNFQFEDTLMPGNIILYSGGTTGLPKAIKRRSYASLHKLIQQFQANGKNIGLDGKGMHLVTGPLYHAAPLYYALYDFFNGASLLIMPKWDTEQFLQFVCQYKVTHTHLVPTHLVRLARLPEKTKNKYSLDTLTLVLLGAAPVAPAVKKQMIDSWGDILVEYWGGSESGLCTKIGSKQWLKKQGSVGKAVPHYRLKIVDPETMSELPVGEIGLILIQHESKKLPYSYHGVEYKNLTDSIDGWFDLGDMGYLDHEGYLFLSDRKKNKIISGGVNIYPAEIESVLFEVASVVDVAVIGMPHPEWGEQPVALMQVENVSYEELRNQLVEKVTGLSKFKQPASYFVVESLLRTPTGKVKTDVLFEMVVGNQFQKEIIL